MKLAAVIPARLNSTRLPNKLLKDICGKSLIVRTYESTFNSKIFNQVLVVTNSKEICLELELHNINYIYKDAEYETGTDRIAAIADEIEADIIINVQGDEPFIKTKTLNNIIKIFKNDKNKSVDVVSVMSKINEKEIKDPNNVKVVVDSENNAIYFSRHPIPFDRDNNGKESFKHIGVYAFRKKALINFSNLPKGKLEEIEKIEALRLIENQINIKMIYSEEIFVGIDTGQDLEKAIKIISEKDSL